MEQRKQEVNIMELSNEELEKKIEETEALLKKLTNDLKEDTSSGWQLRDNIYSLGNQLDEFQIEQIRRDYKLCEKSIPELEEIAHDAYRRVKHMENYLWDVVADSAPENQRGFQNEINYLENLEAAANLEIDRRFKPT